MFYDVALKHNKNKNSSILGKDSSLKLTQQKRKIHCVFLLFPLFFFVVEENYSKDETGNAFFCFGMLYALFGYVSIGNNDAGGNICGSSMKMIEKKPTTYGFFSMLLFMLPPN